MVEKLAEQQWKDLAPTAKRRLVTARAIDEDGQIMENVDIVPRQKQFTPAQVVAMEERKASRELFDKHCADNGNFIFALFHSGITMDQQFPQITRTDMARILYLATYIQWETNLIKQANGRSAGRKQLARMLGMTVKRLPEFLKRVQDADILREVDDEFIFNPGVFYRGKSTALLYDISHLSQTRVFRDTVRQLYDSFKGGRQLERLGLIYAVLPFISFNTNIISHNPEAHAEDIRPIDLSDLTHILGYATKQKLRVALESIKLDSERIFLIIPNPHKKNSQRVAVNTCVVFAASAKTFAQVMSQNVMFNK